MTIQSTSKVCAASELWSVIREVLMRHGKSMRLVGLGTVKDECDVIEQFVRHNLTLLDALVLVDNGSSDGTREILEALRNEELPLVIIDDPLMGHIQAERLTALLHGVGPAVDPDAVFFLDADEFILASSRSALEEAIVSLPTGVAGLLGWTTYLYAPPKVAKRPPCGGGSD